MVVKSLAILGVTLMARSANLVGAEITVLPNGQEAEEIDIDRAFFSTIQSRRYQKGECEVDCDTDSDCLEGLLCADAHKTELVQQGLDSRKAYCGANVGAWNYEVCYDPKNIKGPCTGSCCVIRNFDEVVIEDTVYEFEPIPSIYQGLRWENLYIHERPEEGEFGYETGYYYGTTSLSNVMYNGFGYAGYIRALTETGSFGVKKFTVTPVFYNDVEILVSAYDVDNNLLGNYTEVLEYSTTPVVIKLGTEFQSIYMLKIESANNTHLAIDDMKIC